MRHRQTNQIQISRRTACALGGVVFLLSGLILYSASREGRATSGSPAPESESSGAIGGLFADLREDQAITTDEHGNRVTQVHVRPLLEELFIEREVVCPGEDILLRAIPRNEGSPMRYVVNSQAGDRAIVRWDRPGRYDITAVAREGTDSIGFADATITVRAPDDDACVGRPRVLLNATPTTGMSDHIDLEIVDVRGMQAPYEFDWDFGDGTRTRNRKRVLRHDYSTRDQDRFTSVFVIRVRVRDAAGKTTTARASASLPNAHYLAKLSGYPVMPAQFDRFPVRDGDVYTSHVRFRNIEDQAVDFSAARLEIFSCSGEATATTREVPAADLLSATRIPPRGLQAARLRLPIRLIGQNACQVRLVFTGDTIPVSERRVIAEVALEPGFPEPLEGNAARFGSIPIKDRDLSQKLAKAAEILGRSRITPADLEMLEKQGKL